MLFDSEEIQIMSKAVQPHLREPNRTELVSKNIFDDYFEPRELAGTRVLELGPGQYDFARMVAAAGATVVSMDHDPAVIALGQKRGYNVILADFRQFDWNSLKGEFDGLFCRGSITPLWFRDPDPFAGFVGELCSVLKSDGWGWMVPWNAALSTAAPDYAQRMLDAEHHAFERNGFKGFELSRPTGIRYGVVKYPILFLRGLDLAA